jgi:hypothetical protein
LNLIEDFETTSTNKIRWEHYQFVKMVLNHLNIYFLNEGFEIWFQVSGVRIEKLEELKPDT